MKKKKCKIFLLSSPNIFLPPVKKKKNRKKFGLRFERIGNYDEGTENTKKKKKERNREYVVH